MARADAGVPVRCAALPATGAVLAATDRNQVFLYDLDGRSCRKLA